MWINVKYRCYIRSMSVEVASRELRNDTAGLLRRVEEGERIVITRRGKPVADLIPHREQPRWLRPDEVMEIITKFSADPGLRDDLERLAGDTTADLGPIG
jgi:prevent-host-death family protein